MRKGSTEPEEKLFAWQSQCLDAWAQNGFRGIVNAATGTGKTRLALNAVRILEQARPNEQIRVKIVVPQVFLVKQWRDEIVKQFDIRRGEIGIFQGGRRDTPDRKFMIYVVNSARYSLAKHVLEQILSGGSVLLIADECHHYSSVENSKIFDFLPQLHENKEGYYALGLSATPQTARFEILTTALGDEIFRYGVHEALLSDIISRFRMTNISVDFNRAEEEAYIDLTDKLGVVIGRLKSLAPSLCSLRGDAFFPAVARLAHSHANAELSNAAQAMLFLTYRRSDVVHLAEARSSCAIQLIQKLEPAARIILFCQRIETAQTLYAELVKIYPRQLGIYHSKMRPETRERMLSEYEMGEMRILISCKALDEGLNIPSTDVGIVVSSGKSERQRIQRLGRILRRGDGEKRIYYLFVKQSGEDTELLKVLTDALGAQVPTQNIRYDGRCFYSESFDAWTENVFERTRREGLSKEKRELLRRNMEIGLVRGDIETPEATCRERAVHSPTSSERNYWTSILYIKAYGNIEEPQLGCFHPTP